MTALFDDPQRAAVLSPDGRYRYTLTRRWDDGPLMGWVMLNPSTADAERDDHTVRKCIGFAQRHNAAGIVIVNLFAYRTPEPAVLARAEHEGVDIVGPGNDGWLRATLDNPFDVRPVVAAWGSTTSLRRPKVERIEFVQALVGRRLQRFRSPFGAYVAPHPARLPYVTPLEPFPEAT